MSSQFTFVNVRLSEKNVGSRRRGEGIEAKDRARIRSLAATSQWSRRAGVGDNTVRQTSKPKESSRRSIICVAETPQYEKQGRSLSPVLFSSSSFSPTQSGPLWGRDLAGRQFADHPGCWWSDTDSYESDIDYTLETPGAQKHSTTRNNLLEDENALEVLNSSDIAKSLTAQIRTGCIDPFWTFSVPYRPFLSAVIDHRLTFLSAPIPELDEGNGPNMVLRYFLDSMEDPAFMFAQMLFAGAHLSNSRPRLGYTQDANYTIKPEDIMWLKGCSINAINKALSKPNMTAAETNACVGAITSIALFELLFGDIGLYQTHMAGCKQLIKSRGGLAALSPVHQKLMLWSVGANVIDDERDDLRMVEVVPPKMQATEGDYGFVKSSSTLVDKRVKAATTSLVS